MKQLEEDQQQISEVETYGHGWSWLWERGEYDFCAERVITQRYACRTNDDGDGLWIDGQQIEGTAQFSLPRDYDRARRRIRYYHTGK